MSGNPGKPWSGTIRHTHTHTEQQLGKALSSSDWSHTTIDIWVEPISSASCVWPDPSRVVIEYLKWEAERWKEDKQRRGGKGGRAALFHVLCHLKYRSSYHPHSKKMSVRHTWWANVVFTEKVCVIFKTADVTFIYISQHFDLITVHSKSTTSGFYNGLNNKNWSNN